jgi:acetylglutamate kinase
MEEVIKKAKVLIEALPYIQRFRNEIIVIKFGGAAMEDPEHVQGVLSDITFMECVGMLPVVVHGGGKAISRSMEKAGITSKFIDGLRVTCEKTIDVVQSVMHTEVNPGIVSKLRAMGARAEGVPGEKLFTVHKKTGTNKETGDPIDWGFVGEPNEVNIEILQDLLDRNVIPVVTPLGLGEDNKVHNINADTAASAVAKSLKARKLAFISDVPGLLRDAANPESLITTLESGAVKDLIDQGIVSGGMLPKVTGGVEALKAGVRKIHMIDGRIPHSLLLEIFTDRGVGTEIIRDEQK